MHLEPLIREGQYADAENLAALAIHVFLHTYATQGISSPISRYVLSEFTPERFSAWLASKTDSVFVAEVNGNLVGDALLRVGATCLERVRCTIELSTLYVQGHFVGKGVGSALLAEVEAFGRRGAQMLRRGSRSMRRMLAQSRSMQGMATDRSVLLNFCLAMKATKTMCWSAETLKPDAIEAVETTIHQTGEF